MKIAFYTFGCKVNQYETQALRQQFAARGWEVLDFSHNAPWDAVVVNSCTVTAEGDRKTRQFLRRLRREHPEGVICLTGCFPQAFPEEAAALLEADVITGSRDRRKLTEALDRFLATGERVVEIAPHQRGESFETMSAEEFGRRTRAFVKIEDGCENYCAYCIIPTARGPVRSKPLEDLRRELEGLAGAGYREVVLAGINLSAYGKELGLRLIDAIETAAAVPGIRRLRLGSLEPDVIGPEDFARMAATGKVCPQFHLSLQSGCDATLRRMGRRYDTAHYLATVEEIRHRFPLAAITTDLIVGFPGETEEDFQASAAFARQVGFARIHVFPYSQRPGTRAAKLPGQLPPEVKKRRAGELIALGEELRGAFLDRMAGTTQEVLFEEGGPEGQTGYTANYTPVTVLSLEGLQGQVRSVHLTGRQGDGCTGELAE
ncbi:MAG: tRNA (N(6)-L-threonylcarbamoyladenosine(37)-C(2))-methylthiotransferase MtaB [Angelakisella sp.]|jgi:threonylcarbamoyladenosine tRNA methylthiotransferase MtaB|nr:tRNA (N(6)-L-threonylcarbamoyladenosine(37)-C(2))-methylthiotransferase MtaB [Angelakisella sp.]